MINSKPDFIIIGAPRCGTTTLASWLSQQPGFLMAPLSPEPKHFIVDEEYNKGMDHYIKKNWPLPSGTLSNLIIGEKSTNYLEHKEACLRIKASCPQTKILVVLRDPVERAWSNYKWSVQNGLEFESFEDALQLECKREKELNKGGYSSRWWDYTGRGLYAKHLRCWKMNFNIDVLFYDDLFGMPYYAEFRLQRIFDREISIRGERSVGDYGESQLERLRLNDTPSGEMSKECRAYLDALYKVPHQELEDLLCRKIKWQVSDWRSAQP